MLHKTAWHLSPNGLLLASEANSLERPSSTQAKEILRTASIWLQVPPPPRPLVMSPSFFYKCSCERSMLARGPHAAGPRLASDSWNKAKRLWP